MDKQTESRSQFEAWLKLTPGQTPNLDRNTHNPERYVSFNNQRLWEAWQASRENLAVEFPPEQPYTDGLLADGWNACRTIIEYKLRAIGIRIKGEGV